MKLEEAFQQYFCGEDRFDGLGFPALETNYGWEIPFGAPMGITAEGKGYRPNVDLKLQVAEIWKRHPGRREEMAHWVVEDWGKVRGNRPAKMRSYIELAVDCRINVPLAGIASYSKILAASNPQKYAIYDARVAVSLNAIQYLAVVTEGGLTFPYISGRNKITGHWTENPPQGFSRDPEYNTQKLKLLEGWSLVEKHDAYSRYIQLITKLAEQLNRPIYDLEMALFADAEKIVERTVGKEKFETWEKAKPNKRH